jgi:hypothetical protein
MRPAIFGAALLAGTAFLAMAPAASAQQYGGYPGGYSPSGQPPYSPQSGGGYQYAYGGSYHAASPYAPVCASLAYSVATQGHAARAASPYAFTCEYLGLLGSGPGAGYEAAYGLGAIGPYGTAGVYGQSSYPYSGGGAYYGGSGSVNGLGSARSPYAAGNSGSYGAYWPYSTP